MVRSVVGILTVTAASMVFIFSEPSFSQAVVPNTQDPNAVNRDYVSQRYAVGGKTSIFASYYSLKLDCTPSGWQEVTLSKPPENGEAKLVEANAIINYTAPNPRVKCNGKSTRAMELQYTPNNEYKGNDSIEVELINEAGQRNTFTYNITVK
jgi:hypothetical protein